MNSRISYIDSPADAVSSDDLDVDFKVNDAVAGLDAKASRAREIATLSRKLRDLMYDFDNTVVAEDVLPILTKLNATK